MSHRISIAVLFAAPTLVFALTGCPGSLDNPERFTDGGACSDVPKLLATSCGTSGCHAATNPSNGLDLASADLVGRLSGKTAKGGSGILVDLDSPADSVIYTKILESPPFGGRMPPGAPFDDASAACVLSFLEDEAAK